jgi:short-subunit dehydrogenase
MLEREGGTIVTVASGEGLAYTAAYSASKVAVQSLGLSLADELGDESEVSAFVLALGWWIPLDSKRQSPSSRHDTV